LDTLKVQEQPTPKQANLLLFCVASTEIMSLDDSGIKLAIGYVLLVNKIDDTLGILYRLDCLNYQHSISL